jgi:hypothetical protein
MWPWAKLVATEGLGHRKILDDKGVADKMLAFIQNPIK